MWGRQKATDFLAEVGRVVRLLKRTRYLSEGGRRREGRGCRAEKRKRRNGSKGRSRR
jgi:hypothetical protein